MASKNSPATAPKDPGIAALISVVGMLLLGAPSLGYFYLGNVRKGIVYLVGAWIALAVAMAVAMAVGIATLGLGFCLVIPIVLIALAFDLVIVWDVYLIAQGEKPKLPEF